MSSGGFARWAEWNLGQSAKALQDLVSEEVVVLGCPCWVAAWELLEPAGSGGGDGGGGDESAVVA
jgi:hypothetical protein